MKILQFCKKLPFPPKDGESIAILNFSKAYAELGHSVTVFSINTKRHYFDPEKIPTALSDKIRFENVYLDTDVKPLSALRNLFSNKSYHIDRFVDDEVTKVLRSLLSEEKFDLIQIEGLFGLAYMDVIKEFRPTLISYRAHNVEYQIWERLVQNEKNQLKKWYLKLQTARLKKFEINHWNKPDCIVPISDLDELSIRKKIKSKAFSTVPATIVSEEWESTSELPTAKNIGFLGALDWLPNQEGLNWFIRDVFPLVFDEFPDVQLNIAGRHQPEWMKKWNSQSIQLFGEVESAKEFFDQQSIMIVPLHSGSGMRIKIVEAMAAGKTVVATSIAAEGIPAKHGKEIFLCDDVQSFAKCINLLLRDFEKVKSIGDQARQFALANFDYIQQSKKLLDFYASLS